MRTWILLALVARSLLAADKGRLPVDATRQALV